ncbi:hypothetical protein RJ639_003709 [Escallonia herrerae]|uniref:Potassium transporter n=1 Tax=Escallonia herrerae TaxID=1293975 RepID=A0AA89AYD6_9ASTE|nr:hypothetical protein RJ639_003709 [Escallonia herrerae]
MNQNLQKVSCSAVLTLAYQSLGVVYGDLSTSPLYVYKSTFSGKLSLHENDEEIYGVLSFIFWTFTLIALFKYIFIVMSANDNGEGGTFALYSLLCRHARLSVLPNQQETDEKLSAFAIEGSAYTRQSCALMSFFKKHPSSRKVLFIFVLLGTCMAIGDGVFTPAISDYIVVIACVILVGLFSIQHHGTHRVAFMFAPIIMAWLLCISSIGIYNIIKWNPHIFHALSPIYMLKFLKQTGREGWVSLAGVVLSITGVETMFADLGHFSVVSIKVAFTFLVYPCLILAYLGLAVAIVMFVTTCLTAMVMTIVWKQKTIMTATFLLFFGSVELLYLSAAFFKVPEGGWIPLLLSMIFMVVMFSWNYGKLNKHQFDLENKVSMNRILSLGPSLGMVRVPGIGLVYTNLVTGIPAIFGHFVTNLPAFHQVLIFVCIKSVQVPYVADNERFLVGRVGPKEYSMFRCIVRYGYKDLQQEDYNFENRLVSAVLMFVETEGKTELGPLAGSSKELGNLDAQTLDASEQTFPYPTHEDKAVQSINDIRDMLSGTGHLEGSHLKDESLQILKARESGIAYILGHSYAKAKKSSSIFKVFAIDVVYAFLSRNCRGPDVVLNVPHTSSLEVGMIYYV